MWSLLSAYLSQYIYQNIQKQWFTGPNIHPVKIVIRYMRKNKQYFSLSLSMCAHVRTYICNYLICATLQLPITNKHKHM